MRIVTIDAFLGESDNVRFLVQSLLPNVGWTLLVGERGCGKTTLAIQMCLSIEKGEDVIGLRTAKCRTMYVQADSEEAEFRQIMKRIAPRGGKSLLAVSVPQFFLKHPKDITILKGAIDKHKPGFIVYDSLYKIAGFDVNTDKILIDIYKLKELSNGKPFMVIHHPPHDGTRGAGHHSLEGDCSNAWLLLRNKLKINKGRLVGGEGLNISRDKHGLWYGGKSNVDESEEDTLTYDAIVRRRG